MNRFYKFAKRLRVSMKCGLLLVTFVCLVLGWFSIQRSRYFQELAAVQLLRNEYGAELGWYKWHDPLPHAAESFSAGEFYDLEKDPPAWDWSELRYGRLYKPVNWCRIGWKYSDTYGLRRAILDKECAKALQAIRYLEHLHIETTDDHKQVRFPYEHLNSLEYLEVGNARVSKDEICSIARMKRLRSLVIAAANLTDSDVAALRNLKNLRRLNLYSPLLTDKSIESIHTLVALQDIALEGKLITDRGLRHLRGMRDLSRLYLGNTNITGTGFSVLDGKPITELGLGGANIDDRGVSVIAKALPEIQELNLSQTKITDKCVPDLLLFKSLKILGIEFTAISGEELVALQQLEDCKVYH